MAKYRKKPVVIDAVQWLDGTYHHLPEWARKAASLYSDDSLLIKTLEGDMRADPGDWLIRGVAGEVYPCKPNIFEQLYEPA